MYELIYVKFLKQDHKETHLYPGTMIITDLILCKQYLKKRVNTNINTFKFITSLLISNVVTLLLRHLLRYLKRKQKIMYKITNDLPIFCPPAYEVLLLISYPPRTKKYTTSHNILNFCNATYFQTLEYNEYTID